MESVKEIAVKETGRKKRQDTGKEKRQESDRKEKGNAKPQRAVRRTNQGDASNP